jgi:hypothetical protein
MDDNRMDALRKRYGRAEGLSFDDALAAFLAKAQAIIDDHYARNYPTQGAVLTAERGPRYVRIVRSYKGETSRSAHCFIDTTNGDVLKADGWKKPAKHARGNIFAENAVAGMGPHGALYLRR